MKSQPQDKTRQTFTATEAEEGQRIDNFLVKKLKGVPKSLLYKLLRKGAVKVNHKKARQTYRLCVGDEVSIPNISTQNTSNEALKIPSSLQKKLESSILYEDKDICIINKPSGLAVHGGSGLSFGLIEALRVLWPHSSQIELVHRLDRGTSGCLIIAKKRSVLKKLHEMITNHEVEKHYLALVVGKWPKKVNRINLPLGQYRDSSGERVVSVAKEGKPALTTVQIKQQFTDYTLLSIKIATGRMHQIRVHTKAYDHPIAGDEKYGDKAQNKLLFKAGIKRICLHAYKLKFMHPVTGEKVSIEAPLDTELSQFLSKLE